MFICTGNGNKYKYTYDYDNQIRTVEEPFGTSIFGYLFGRMVFRKVIFSQGTKIYRWDYNEFNQMICDWGNNGYTNTYIYDKWHKLCQIIKNGEAENVKQV